MEDPLGRMGLPKKPCQETIGGSQVPSGRCLKELNPLVTIYRAVFSWNLVRRFHHWTVGEVRPLKPPGCQIRIMAFFQIYPPGSQLIVCVFGGKLSIYHALSCMKYVYD